MNRKPKYAVVDFDAISPVDCPCGTARRALQDVEEFPGTLHRTEISTDARLHYHKTHTETYYILECDDGARIQLDEQLFAVKPGMAIVIPPGVCHRAVGIMTVLIVCIPEFDPLDEWFDVPAEYELPSGTRQV